MELCLAFLAVLVPKLAGLTAIAESPKIFRSRQPPGPVRLSAQRPGLSSVR